MPKKKKRTWVNKEQIRNLSTRTIQVRVSSFEKGLEIYNEIKVIRIVSAKYNLLIMSGFQPLLGEIQGEVTLISEENEYQIKDINAFYCFRKNVLKILIKENENVL